MAAESRVRTFGRAIAAETIKLKHTLTLWMCVIAPAVVALLQALQLLARRLPAGPTTPDPALWNQFGSAVLALWAFLMLPLFVTLQAALLGALEHQNQQWKHLLALPVPRTTHVLAKALALATLVALAMGLLVLLLIPACGALLALRPALGLTGTPDLAALSIKAVQVYLASLLMMALQLWVALRWRSFTIAVAIGMSATVIGFLVGQSESFGPWFPWTMAVQPLTRHPEPWLVGAISVAGASVVLLWSAWSLARREDTG
jgi:lantibiotic transport system permease protein